MPSSSRPWGRPLPAHFFGGTGRRRPLRPITLGAFAALLFAPGLATAQSERTIDLSPMVAKSTVLSAADPAKEVSVVLSLPLSDSQGAAAFVQHVSNPKDPLYRHYLTPAEFAARYGGNAGDYAAIKEWATANHLTITQESIARTSLTVRGTVAQLQQLFKTLINNYRSPDGQEFYSASAKPTIPSAISSKVAGVIGLTSSRRYAPLVKIHKVFGEKPEVLTAGPETPGGTGPGAAYSASDLRNAYSIPTLGNLVPQTVAVFEQGGFTASDVQLYLQENKLPNVPVGTVLLNGFNGAVNDPHVELEAVLDIDMVIGINPNVKSVLVYEDGNSGDSFEVALVVCFEQVLADGLASVLSVSYGQDEVQQGRAAMQAENTALIQLAAQGITVLVSAGDQGAYGDTGGNTSPATLNVSDPGAQPYVTCVGGTTLYTDVSDERWLAEEVWNDLGENFGATGGGVSSFWPIPSWQQPPIYSGISANGGSTSFRNVPDVACVGNELTGVAVYSNLNGGWLQVGGTSVSAPIWASYASILNSASLYLGKGRLGFFNPELYSLLIRVPAGLTGVEDGSNGNVSIYGTPGYNAGRFYNNCCGLGTMAAAKSARLIGVDTNFATVLLSDAHGLTPPPGPLTGLTAKQVGTSLELSWNPSTGASGYIVELENNAPPYPWAVDQCHVTKATTQTVDGVAAGTVFQILVQAVNQGGRASEIIQFQTN